MGRGGIALMLALSTAAGTARGDGPARMMMDPVPVGRAAAVKPIDPVRTVALDARDLPPADDDTPKPRAGRFTRPDGDRRIPAHVVEAPKSADKDKDKDADRDDFTGRRSDLGRRRDDDRKAGKFGDKFNDIFGSDGRKGWFQSDHGFDNFASPISNPFLFEDPRATTEIRPVFIYQKIPSPQPNFQGGSLWFLGGRGSIAFTDRFSVTVNKLGAISVNPGSKSLRDSDFGFAEIWLGPKVTIYRDPDFGTILAAGGIFQLPTGSAKANQDTGRLGVTPYLSIGQSFLKTRVGSLNAIATGGYSFSTDRDRSDYFYLSAHLDFDILDLKRFYPIAELNWFQYTTNGTNQNISGEGRDLINFGGQAKGASLVTGALGGRVKITEAAQIGAAFELPLIGNRDYFQYRFTVDMIFRW